MKLKLTADVVAGLVGSCFAPRFDNATASPQCHYEWWELCCSPAKYVAIAAPRGHAKTTAVTVGYGLATLLFRDRRFMVIVSDTEAQASMFLNNMKMELTDNPTVAELFDLKMTPAGDVDFVKNTETDMIVQCNDGHTFRVMAKGAEQKLRGMNWAGVRPDIVICDDMENDELVMNKERRDKLKAWFSAALLPMLSKQGIIRVVGTILHMDSLLETFMPENQVQGLRAGKKINYLKEDELKVWTEYRTPWKSARYRAHNPDFSAILWPSRMTKQDFQDLYDMLSGQGLSDLYSQEYLNRPLDEKNTYFKRQDFIPMTAEDRKATVNYYVTADLAISEKERADYSVFVIAGVDEHKHIQVRNVIRERLDGREIVDTLMMIQKVYNPVAIGIEEMQISKSLGPFIREEMIKQNNYISLHPMRHMNKDKIMRARSIQARMRAGSVRFAKDADWYPTFEDECMRFPRDKHDDQVDAFAYLGLMLDVLIEAPTPEEEAEDEWLEEFNESGNAEQGRSMTTGY